ncbi:MAG: hypothetical protein A2Y25_05585 [Candidatus Melainabacteria bacterium GWF2_37_15]|nr:MAG: hypothetical protein A2Y25_05585 [Candidatus Melainabacteria bacterium GWF2_37_15]
MKITFIHPPQWIPLNPYFSSVSLVSQLKGYGYDVKVRDINAEFYNHILTKEYLVNAINKAFNMQEPLLEEILKEFMPDKKQDDYSRDMQRKILKYSKIKEFKGPRFSEAQRIPEIIQEAVAIMKCKERFFQPELLIEAMNDIDVGLELAALPYFPTRLELHDYYTQFFRLTMDSIKECCFDKSTNMFYEFYDGIVPSLLEDSPDMIAISINSSTQIVPGLTLAMLLKEKTSAHINIGGNFFGRVVDALVKTPEFFELFADSVVIEEGEKPMVELARFVEGKLDKTEVPNLIYPEDGAIKANLKCHPLLLNEMQPQTLDGFPLDLYFTPHIVLSAMTSRGCYWKKCTFCDHDFGQYYCIKDLDRLIDEMKFMKEKYGIFHYEFIDESVSPSYLRQMSQRIIDEGMEVYWFNNARTEDEFTPDILKLAGKAGLRMALWGIETGSERIFNLINKGVDFNNRLKILKNSIESGIWNFAFIFFGFPTETREEGMATIDLVCNNTDIICSYGRSVFTLGKHTRLRDDPEKFCITKIFENDEEFSPSYNFATSEGMSPEEIRWMADLCSQKCNEAYNNPLWMFLRYREIIFLYAAKYGAKELQACKVAR